MMQREQRLNIKLFEQQQFFTVMGERRFVKYAGLRLKPRPFKPEAVMADAISCISCASCA